MKICTVCGRQSYRSESQFCQKCGAGLPDHEEEPVENLCTNPNCEWHRSRFIYPDDASFCDMCGTRTVYAFR